MPVVVTLSTFQILKFGYTGVNMRTFINSVSPNIISQVNPGQVFVFEEDKMKRELIFNKDDLGYFIRGNYNNSEKVYLKEEESPKTFGQSFQDFISTGSIGDTINTAKSIYEKGIKQYLIEDLQKHEKEFKKKLID
jgi:hypothetical protein